MTREPGELFSAAVHHRLWSLAQLVRAPSHSRRAEAARHTVLLAAGGAAIIVLMYAIDVPGISAKPLRGSRAFPPASPKPHRAGSSLISALLAFIVAICADVLPAREETRVSIV